MHGSGRVERYDAATGAQRGTLITGLANPSIILPGPDGTLCIFPGVPGSHGTVERLDARTGRRLRTFISIPAGHPGHLARGTGMAWFEGDLLVASQGDGKVKWSGAKTGAWKAGVAAASPGGITQIALRDGRLYLTGFIAQTLRI